MLLRGFLVEVIYTKKWSKIGINMQIKTPSLTKMGTRSVRKRELDLCMNKICRLSGWLFGLTVLERRKTKIWRRFWMRLPSGYENPKYEEASNASVKDIEMLKSVKALEVWFQES
jgi:hypothetical protein